MGPGRSIFIAGSRQSTTVEGSRQGEIPPSKMRWMRWLSWFSTSFAEQAASSPERLAEVTAKGPVISIKASASG